MTIRKKAIIILTMISLFTTGMVATVFASYGDVVYLSTSKRYMQSYSLTTTTNWRWSTNYYDSGVKKVYSSRDFVEECLSNTQNTYRTYYRVEQAYTEAIGLTETVGIYGAASDTGSYYLSSYSGKYMCLGLRNDSRATGSYKNIGNWSPDMY